MNMEAVRNRPPIKVDGVTYWLSHHAAQRALEMKVPLQLLPHIIRQGARADAPSRSKYAGCYVLRAGKVSLGIAPSPDGPVISTVLWATVEAWREAAAKGGRKYRGDDYAQYNLNSWFGDTA